MTLRDRCAGDDGSVRRHIVERGPRARQDEIVLLRQLEYLCALAHEGHFGRAAESCHVSQPALSGGLRKLEAELGVQLVRRGRRFEGLTPEGEQVLAWARRIVASTEAMHEELTARREGPSGVLRIGSIPTAMSAAALLTSRLRSRYGRVRISLETVSSRNIVERLAEFDIDVGLTYIDGEPLGNVHVLPLYQERYLLLTPLVAEFAREEPVSWRAAAELPLCQLAPRMQNRRILDRNFAEAGVSIDPVVETDTVSSIFHHVAEMQISSVIPHAWLHHFHVPDGTGVVPMARPARSHHVGLVFDPHDPQPLLVGALIDVAQQIDVAASLDRAVRRHLEARRPRL